MVKKRMFLLLVLLLAGLCGNVKADELDELRQQLAEQAQKLLELQQRLEQLEAKQKLKEQSLTERIERLAQKADAKEAAVLPESIKWAEKVKISGDFRYRHDQFDYERTDSVRWHDGQSRHRIRARLMFEAILNGDWGVAFRIASGGSRTPISANQDLEDAFSSKYIWLDLAYFDWHPATVEGLNVCGGKIKNPFHKVGDRQHIWDSDLNPEGIAARYVKPLSDVDEVFLSGGGFWVDEIHSTSDIALDGADISLWAGQAYWKHTIGRVPTLQQTAKWGPNPDYILAGASYYGYANLKGQANISGAWSASASFFGNTSSAGTYVSDYDILEAFGEYGFECIGLPSAVFGSWVQNLVASTNQDTGWLMGGRLNKAKEARSWELSYDFRELEADAVVGGLSESEWVGGGTDGRGHRFGFKYQIYDNLQIALTYFHLEDDTPGNSRDLDYRRLLADLIGKF